MYLDLGMFRYLYWKTTKILRRYSCFAVHATFNAMTLWIQDFLLWFKTFLRSSFVEDLQKPCSKQKRYCCKKKKRFKRSFIFFITHPCFFIAFKSVTSTKMTEVFKTASSATNKLQWHTHTHTRRHMPWTAATGPVKLNQSVWNMNDFQQCMWKCPRVHETRVWWTWDDTDSPSFSRITWTTAENIWSVCLSMN